MKIVSLVPSASEVICDLGLEKNLVGVSHECNYPKSLLKINTVTSSNIDSAKSQREIDKSVREKVNENSPLYEVDIKKINQLKPDIIITQGICDVCAISSNQVEVLLKGQLCTLPSSTKIISLNGRSFDDICNDILTIGETLNQKDKSQKIFKHSELYKNPEIKFNKSNILGPNALALPGGPIIITDDLVELLKDDDLILSVIAHEIAHIKERHSLQQIVEIAGLSSIAWMIFGLDESILEEIVFIGINIWGLKKSRDLEKDADIIALKLLEKTSISKTSFILAIEKLTDHYCIATKIEKSVCMNEVKSGWLSTHPSGAERLKYLRNNIN